PHRGRHEPVRAVPLRAAAGDVLRGEPRACRRALARERRLGDRRDRTGRDRDARARDGPDAAPARERPGGAPGRPAVSLGLARPRPGRLGERPLPDRARPERAHPGGQGGDVRHPARALAARGGLVSAQPHVETEAWPQSYGDEARPRMGFFTDTSVCIGCKACEVACKEWNQVPEDGLLFTGDSYDNTGKLGANTWRHVAFIEQDRPLRVGDGDGEDGDAFRWLMSSD